SRRARMAVPLPGVWVGPLGPFRLGEPGGSPRTARPGAGLPGGIRGRSRPGTLRFREHVPKQRTPRLSSLRRRTLHSKSGHGLLPEGGPSFRGESTLDRVPGVEPADDRPRLGRPPEASPPYRRDRGSPAVSIPGSFPSSRGSNRPPEARGRSDGPPTVEVAGNRNRSSCRRGPLAPGGGDAGGSDGTVGS